MKQIKRIWKYGLTTRKIRNTSNNYCRVYQTGRRRNSAVDLSSILRVEIYDPARAETHAVIIDALIDMESVGKNILELIDSNGTDR